jgi:hypothetical protein
MADFINTIDLYGDAATAAKIVDKTIMEFADDVLKKIKDRSFYQCGSLVSVDVPAVTNVGSNAFYQCYELVSVNVPSAQTIGSGAFEICSKLTDVNAMSASNIGSSAFRTCTELVLLDLPSATYIGDYAFLGSKKMVKLVLRSQSVCKLSNTRAFNTTPFASDGTGGTAYVPQALIEQYQTATNWSTLYAAGTCNFVAIEGSEYE